MLVSLVVRWEVRREEITKKETSNDTSLSLRKSSLFWPYHDLVFHDHPQIQDRKAKLMRAIARNFCIVSNTNLSPHHTYTPVFPALSYNKLKKD